MKTFTTKLTTAVERIADFLIIIGGALLIAAVAGWLGDAALSLFVTAPQPSTLSEFNTLMMPGWRFGAVCSGLGFIVFGLLVAIASRLAKRGQI